MKIEIMMFVFAFGFCIGAVAAMVKEQYRRKMQRRNEFINRRTNSTTEAFAGIAQALNQMNDTVATTTKGITKFKGSSNSMTNDEYRNALKRDLDERKKSKSTNH